MSDDIYTYIEQNFNIKITDYQFKRDYIKNPLYIAKNGIGSERPYKEDLEYLYIKLNISLKNIQKLFNISEPTAIRWNRFYKIKKDKKLSHKNKVLTFLEKYNVINNSQLKSWKNKIKENKEKIIIKRLQTSKKNKTEGKSNIEKEIFNILKSKFSDTVFQYYSKLYPFKCDYYIPSLDLYIEYQGFWHHGNEPYKNTPEHNLILDSWISKSNNSNKLKNQYSDAIYIWTKRDPLKRETAKLNNLKWIEFFTFNEFIEWFNCQEIFV